MGVAADERRASAGFVVGGAGFIGSHFVDRLLGEPEDRAVTVYDNFSSGRELAPRRTTATTSGCGRATGDVKRPRDAHDCAWRGHDVVVHLASNPDIAGR